MCGGQGRVALGAAVSPEKTFFACSYHDTAQALVRTVTDTELLLLRLRRGGADATRRREGGTLAAALSLPLDICLLRDGEEGGDAFGNPR